MKIYLTTLLAGLFSPMLAFATNGVGVLEMHPYVTGRDFPWIVPVVGLLLLGLYLVGTIASYRDAESH